MNDILYDWKFVFKQLSFDTQDDFCFLINRLYNISLK